MEISVKGVPNLSARVWFALSKQRELKTDIIFLVNPEEASEALNALEALLTISPKTYEIPQLCMWEGNIEQRAEAVKILCSPNTGKFYFHIASKETIAENFPAALAYAERTINIKRGTNYSRGKLISQLAENGYERAYFVEEHGYFAVRGSILDIFPLDSSKPVRLFFNDDKIEAIRYFEIDTQHTDSFLDSLAIPPVKFGGICKPFTSFFANGYCAIGEKIPENIELKNFYSTGFTGREYQEDFAALRNVNFGLSPDSLAAEIRRLRKNKCKIYFFCINRGEAQRIAELLIGQNLGGLIIPKIGYIAQGFIREKESLAILTASEYFNRQYSFNRNTNTAHKKFFKWTDLRIGDYIVHEDYGIGRYRGLKKVYYRSIDGKKQEDSDCLYLEYARGDTLFVPLDEFSKVQKFISSEGKIPHLSHMDTKTWKEVKGRVKEEVRVLAGNILRLEAQRAACRTVSFAHGGNVEEAFAEAFPYEETPDQKKAIHDVLTDMEAQTPMNRLIAGDVGFGKTEIAMRAAMRAVLNGRQTAVIAPTTILADQHYHSFVKRFSAFPVIIKTLSRFVPKKEQKQTLRELANGQVDIIIGTHRLLQKDIKFTNLGLMVVDEEHRFGVKAKDKIKITAKGVHCLLMSATPIPRTLYQSLSSLKSMSTIESPPVGRQAVATFVRPFSEKDAGSAVACELARGGQVFYVHNRVQTIESRGAYLKKIMPELRIAIVHGQLTSEAVAGTMKDFLDKKYDVLLATTIIESGIDIPNVNTLIVENAHELGLAQLYQLRGRIGREKRKAFCYLYYPSWIKPNIASKNENTCEKKDLISETAAKRLSALEEFTSLGSGLRLAMRDLEIRGAGDLLGIRQHGFINTVGLEMYIKLLNGEINRLKGKVSENIQEPRMDILVQAFLPEDYITDEMERLNFYKKVLNSDIKSLPSLLKELEDLCGQAPEPVKNLFHLAGIKKKLAHLGVRSVGQINDNLEIFFNHNTIVNQQILSAWQKNYGDKILFMPSPDGDGFRINKVDKPINFLENFIKLSGDKK